LATFQQVVLTLRERRFKVASFSSLYLCGVVDGWVEEGVVVEDSRQRLPTFRDDWTVSDKTSTSSANFILLTQLADEFAARHRVWHLAVTQKTSTLDGTESQDPLRGVPHEIAVSGHGSLYRGVRVVGRFPS
jgi:hypothetical protein